ncbi:hypothetical protein HELRODRAFT_175873 [Helobdella robusta]|uniref:Endonuclease/exonuclease/phosphatase domain-containing protein n=1 Tax=Helobdella robusta TaxID=6412 RepID=T1F9T3_HELRO|nr:hypothetical protein HELRODRAFT_175873 [Helobdella robusta]ESO00442.1 hypothetical protein HELRODRAFT_175873 [Helobdella robusta]
MAVPFRKDRPDTRRRGGVVIYLKSSISFQIHIIFSHAIMDALENLCLKFQTLMGYIDELSNTALESNSKLIIGGDFNQLDHHSILQTAPSWFGFATQQLQQLQSLIKKLIRFNYLPASYPAVTQIFNTLDSKLFKQVENNNNHVIHPLLSPIKTTTHNLRQRKHNYQVATQSTYQEKIFITRYLKHINTQ